MSKTSISLQEFFLYSLIELQKLKLVYKKEDGKVIQKFIDKTKKFSFTFEN